MGRVALIDGDVIVYKAAWAAETGIEWGDGVHTLHVDPATLADIAETVLAQIESALKPTKTIITLSDSKVFRHDFFPEYKANRKLARKPIAYKAARAYMEAQPNVICRTALEADDVMGILATGDTVHARDTDERIICSVDKDMKQIPGLHYDWTKDTEVRTVSALEADAFFYAQCLAGDSTDGIPGIKGVGMVKATKMLMGSAKDTAWEVIVDAYAKHGHDETYALTMARLVRILRAEDYNFETKEIRLWTPA
jgi:DNA polymerase-1